jgi:hypothetical protein
MSDRIEYGVRVRLSGVTPVSPDADTRTVMSDADYTRVRAEALGGVPVWRTVTELVSEWTPLPVPDGSQTSEMTVTLTVTDQRRALRWLADYGQQGGVVAVEEDQ